MRRRQENRIGDELNQPLRVRRTIGCIKRHRRLKSTRFERNGTTHEFGPLVGHGSVVLRCAAISTRLAVPPSKTVSGSQSLFPSTKYPASISMATPCDNAHISCAKRRAPKGLAPRCLSTAAAAVSNTKNEVWAGRPVL